MPQDTTKGMYQCVTDRTEIALRRAVFVRGSASSLEYLFHMPHSHMLAHMILTTRNSTKLSRYWHKFLFIHKNCEIYKTCFIFSPFHPKIAVRCYCKAKQIRQWSSGLRIFFCIYLFILFLQLHCSSLPPSLLPVSLHLPIHYPSISLQKRTSIPQISTSHGMYSCSETRDPLSY